MSTKYMKLTYAPLRGSKIHILKEGDHAIGYEFPIRLNYYRGIHLSTILEFEIRVDDQIVHPLCELKGKIFRPEEFKDMYKEWWGVRDRMVLKIYNNEGISLEPHKVDVHCICKCAYMKFAPGVYAMFDSSDSAILEVAGDNDAEAASKHSPLVISPKDSAKVSYTAKNPRTGIKKAVSLYSYGEEWIMQDNLTCEDLFRHLHSLGVHTLEVVGSQTFSEYPIIPEAEVQELLALCKKYDMEFYCYDGYTDHGKIWNHDLTEEEILQEMTYDIISAKRLGCKLMKSGIPAPFLHKVLPIAEMFDIKLCVELHAPETPGNDYCQEYARTIRELNTDRIGLCPDFGMFILKPNDILIQKYKDLGVDDTLLQFIIDNRFNGYTEETMWEKIQSMGGDDNAHLAVSEMFGFLSWSKTADFEGLKSILPYCIYFHGKFYHIDENCVETTIPYRELLTMISESGFNGYIATEYEGHALCSGQAPEQIARHIKMETDILETL